MRIVKAAAVQMSHVIPNYPYFSLVQFPLQNIAGPEQQKLLDQAATVPSVAPDSIIVGSSTTL